MHGGNVGGFVGNECRRIISNSFATGTATRSSALWDVNSGGTYTNDWFYSAQTDSYATKANSASDFYNTGNTTGSATGGAVYLVPAPGPGTFSAPGRASTVPILC